MSQRIQRALVTGASSGIGAALARSLATRGVALVLVARRTEELEALAATLDVPVEVLPADLATDVGRRLVTDRIGDPAEPIDLLINNAGLGAYGPVAEQDPSRLRHLLEVNVTTLTELSAVAAERFGERRAGGIINVGSVAGFQPGPHGAVYGATKAYVRSLTEALHEELAPSGVHVMLLAPGFTRTGFQAAAEVAEHAVPRLLWGDAGSVAERALSDFAAGRAVCVPGPLDRALALGAQLVPSAVSRRISGAVHRRLHAA